MTFLAAILGFFKFFDECSALIKLLQSTPEENHQKILENIQKEQDHFEQTGRPTWNG